MHFSEGGFEVLGWAWTAPASVTKPTVATKMGMIRIAKDSFLPHCDGDNRGIGCSPLPAYHPAVPWPSQWGPPTPLLPRDCGTSRGSAALTGAGQELWVRAEGPAAASFDVRARTAAA